MARNRTRRWVPCVCSHLPALDGPWVRCHTIDSDSESENPSAFFSPFLRIERHDSELDLEPETQPRTTKRTNAFLARTIESALVWLDQAGYQVLAEIFATPGHTRWTSGSRVNMRGVIGTWARVVARQRSLSLSESRTCRTRV